MFRRRRYDGDLPRVQYRQPVSRFSSARMGALAFIAERSGKHFVVHNGIEGPRMTKSYWLIYPNR